MITGKFTTAGNYHKKRGMENQDVVWEAENSRYQVMLLGDGASVCRNGRKGAEIACETAGKYMMKEGKGLCEFDESKIAYLVTEEVLFELEKFAAAANEPLESYASTLLFYWIDKKDKIAITFNLGDGAVFYAEQDECNLTLPPVRYGEKSCCLTTTRGAYKSAQVKKLKYLPINSFFACSDGVYDLMRDKTVKKRIKNAVLSGNGAEIYRCINEAEKADDCSFIFNFGEKNSVQD